MGIAFVVGTVDGQDGAAMRASLGDGVIVPGCVKLIDGVIGISA